MAAFRSAMSCSIEPSVRSTWFPSARELSAFRTSPRVKSERLRAPWRSRSGLQLFVFVLAEAEYHQAVSSVTEHEIRPCSSSSHEKTGHLRVRSALDGTDHLAVDFYGYGAFEGFHSHYALKSVVFPHQDALQSS